MEIRHKNSKDENFSVGMMVDKKLRPIVAAYYRFAREADDIADSPDISPEQKVKALDEMENALFGSAGPASAMNLHEIFLKENFSFSLASDLLKAFRRDALGFEYKIWPQLVDYCQFSAVPVGRFMLALHFENPSTYLPAASLCTVLQIVNHIQDIKYDYSLLKRIYIPADLMDKYGVVKEDLKADKCSENLKNLIDEMLKNVKQLLKESRLLPSIISDLRLRTEVCVIISLTNFMIKRIEKGDVLASRIKLSKIDWLKAVVFGVLKSIFMKKRLSYERY